MKPCISEATTLSSDFAADVAAYADAGCPGMEVWLTKLEQYLEKHSATETRRLLNDRGIALAAASYQGGLLLSQGDARRAHFEHFKRRLDLCQSFAIPTLVLVADFAQARANVVDYSAALDQLGALNPDVWLPAVPADGQNANCYDDEWADTIAGNRALVQSWGARR